MKMLRNYLLAMILGVSGIFAGIVPGQSAAFHAWRIADVPNWDTLNIRAYPSAKSRILVAYPNGTLLSLTGVCTNGLHLDQIGGLPAWKKREQVRYRWCQVWLDPHGNGEFQPAWVYGRYIKPA